MNNNFVPFPAAGPDAGFGKRRSPAPDTNDESAAVQGELTNLYRRSLRIPTPTLRSADPALHPVQPTIAGPFSNPYSTADGASGQSVFNSDPHSGVPGIKPPSADSAIYMYEGLNPSFADATGNFGDGSARVVAAAAANITSAFGGLLFGDVSFMFNGTVIEPNCSGSTYVKVLVDDMLVNNGNVIDLTTTGVGNSPAFFRITFATRAVRKITLRFCSGNPRFFGTRCARTDSVWRPATDKTIRCIAAGDSFMEPTFGGPGDATDQGLGSRLGRTFNWDLWPSGSGGTGFTTNGGISGKYKLRDRFANDVAAQNPNVLLIAMGGNDASNVVNQGIGVLTAELNLLTPLIAAVSSIREVIVWGPFRTTTNNGGADPSTNATNNSIAAAMTAWTTANNSIRVPWRYIDCSTWWTGTGKYGSTTGNGNGDVIVGSDGVHPTPEGHCYLASRIASEYLRLRQLEDAARYAAA